MCLFSWVKNRRVIVVKTLVK